MYMMEIGVLKDGVKDKLDEYYDHPDDLFTVYYELSDFYKTPSEWYPLLGERKQMDWGSWLSVCSYNQVQKLMSIKPSHIAKIIPASEKDKVAKVCKPQQFSELPKAEWYGIMEVEVY